MELTGFTLTQVLTVLGAVGFVVLVLYLLKLRRRQVIVPFVKLWETVLAEKQTTRLLSQLKRWLSFLLALSIVALVAFALGDPRYAGATAAGRTLVVLVDASASMQATDVEPTRFEQAREYVRTLAEELGPADRMLVAQMDAAATPVTPLTGDRAVLRTGIDALHVTDVRANVEAGLRLALDVLRGASNPEIVLVTDGGNLHSLRTSAARVDEGDVDISWIPVGEGGRNVGITAFAVRRYPLDKSQSEVLVELWNPTEQDEAVEMTLLGDGEEVDIQRLVVRKGERLRRFFRNISGVDQTLEARIRLADGTRDVLAVDDRAFARLPERRRARILSVSTNNLYLQAALLLDEYLEVTDIGPEQYPLDGRFDVTIFDSFVPSTPPANDALYIYPLPPEGSVGPFVLGGVVEMPVFSHVERQHPLTRWTSLRDVNIAEALDVELQEGDRAVAGDRGVPLIVEGRRGNHRIVALTFDVRQSDLPLRVAWPLFLLNAIDWFVQESDEYVSSYRVGDTWHIPVPAGVAEATVVDPEGSSRTVPVVDGRAVYAGSEAGFYRVVAGESEDLFAANLGLGDESRVDRPARLVIAGREAGEVSRGEVGLRRELWIYLVALVVMILLAEWFTYHRRLTV